MSSNADQRGPSLDDIARSVTGDASLEHQVVVEFDDWRLRLVSNNASLIERVAEYLELFTSNEHGEAHETVVAVEGEVPEMPFEFFDWARGPDKVGKKEQIADIDGGWIVRKVRTGMHFLLGGGHRVAVGPCEDNDNQIVNFINAQFIGQRMREGWTLCHAAGVATGGRGVGLAGISGAGKSTLALHAMNHGLHFVSNDRLLIKRHERPRMAGVPKHPRINPGTALSNPTLSNIVPDHRRAALQSMSLDELWTLEEKYDADIGALYDGRWATSAELGAFVILRWHRNETAPTEIHRVDLAERRDMWPALLKNPGPLYVGEGETRAANTLDVAPEPYLDVLADVPIFEVTGRVDFELATRKLLELLEDV